MKKFKCLLFIMFFLLFPNIVLAEFEHNHIFSIENFTIAPDGSWFTIEGYSYISHQDNWGIMSEGDKKGKGNLETYIVAYTGVWENEYTGTSEICKNGTKCLSFKTVANNRDMWYARCTIGRNCGNKGTAEAIEKEQPGY